MIDSNKTSLLNLFKQQKSVTSDAGLVIEYNMNSMIDGITVSSATADSSYTSQISDWPSEKPNPYKKLFPVDSIIKPFRPLTSGIKYFILEKPVVNGGPSEILKNSFSNYRAVSYPESQPRVYYPGESTYYKYWVTPQNTGVNITVNYLTNATQYALTNKILLKFETTHSLPSTYTVKIVKPDNTEQVIANQIQMLGQGLQNTEDPEKTKS
jgi:hypothetical protein